MYKKKRFLYNNSVYSPECFETVDQWVDSPRTEKGYTIANAKYKREYWQLNKLLKFEALKLYILVVDLGIKQNSRLMYSTSKQAEYCAAVCGRLNEKKVEPIHYKIFDQEIKRIRERLRFVEKITNENIRLTEYGLFSRSIKAY